MQQTGILERKWVSPENHGLIRSAFLLVRYFKWTQTMECPFMWQTYVALSYTPPPSLIYPPPTSNRRAPHPSPLTPSPKSEKSEELKEQSEDNSRVEEFDLF